MVTPPWRHHLFCYPRWLRDPLSFLLYSWIQRRNVVNQWQPQLLKYIDASQANELALMTNVLGYVSTLLSKALFPRKCSSFTIPGCFGILSIKHIYLNWNSFSYLSKLIIMELQKLHWISNNIRNLLWKFQSQHYHQFITTIPKSLSYNIKHLKLIR